MIRNALRLSRGLKALLLSLPLGLLPLLSPLQASDQRYDYDEAGRLIRSIDEQGRVTEYRYDPVGNILQVIGTTGGASAPAIDAFTPTRINHGDRLDAVAQGSGLNGARVTSSDPGLQVSGVTTGDGRVDLQLYADPALPIGPQILTFTTAAGSASATVEVRPEVPRAYLTPVPVARLPDGVMHPVILWLSHADVEPHTFTLSLDDPTVAQLASTTLTIPAGETEARTQLAGLTEGSTALRAEAAGVAPLAVPVYVATQIAGINTRYATRLGVVVEEPAGPPPQQEIANLTAQRVGVIHGAALHRVEPAQRTVGTGPEDLILHGGGLQDATTLTLTPPDGVTLGPVTPSADGTTATVAATIAADAPLGLRRLTLLNAAGTPYPAVGGGDRLLITPPPPIIDSVDPLLYIPGINGQTLTLRGHNFSDLYRVDVTPADGITVGTPEISDSGEPMVVTAPIAIAPDAALGPRVVTLTTAGGTSAPTASAHNTIHLALTGTEVPNLAARPIGVVRPVTPEPLATDYAAYAAPLGVVHGATLTTLDPRSGIIGTTVQLTIEGRGLQNAASVALHPTDGLTVETPAPAADGRSLTVIVTIAADAPTTPRTVSVRDNTGSAIPTADPLAMQFLVTPPPPEIDSVTPLFLLPDGNPATVTLRGRNFDNTVELRLLPGDGAVIGPVTLNGDATEAAAPVTLTPGAPIGPRVVQLVTTGGVSDATPGPHNTVTVSDQTLAEITPLTAPLLGVVKQVDAPPATTDYTFVATPLGVVVEIDPLANAPTGQAFATPLGIAVGPIATAAAPAGAVAGSSLTLTVSGEGLGAVSEVQLHPADGVTLDPLITVGADGRTLDVAIDLALDAPGGPRAVQLLDAAGTAIPFADPAAAIVHVHGGEPTILSIEPILAGMGDTVELIIRGEHLHAAQAVSVTPADGVAVGPVLQVNDLGTEVRLPLQVAADAALGTRVIRLHLPGHDTPAPSTPANTFTVYESVP